MSFYIWLNADGNEIKREDKGRGRPRIDAKQAADGNWYIGGMPKNVTPKEQVKVAPIVPDADELDQTAAAFSEAGRAAKVFNNAAPVELSALLKAVFRNPNDESRENGEIDMRRVVIHDEPGVTGITFNAVYARLVIKKDGSVYIWSNANGDVTYIINNAVKVLPKAERE